MSALADSRFRRLLTGHSVSSFGDTALYLSLGIWAKDLTGQNAAAGAVFLCLSLPVLFSPLSGHLVDRWRRRRTLIVVNLLTGLGVLALLGVHSAADLWIIYAVAFGYGLSFTLRRPAQAGLVKMILPGDDLAGANAAVRTIGEAIRLLSPLAGAALYSAIGGRALVGLTSVTFAVAIVMLLSISLREPRPVPVKGNTLREITAGAAHLARTPLLAFTSVAVAVSFAVLGLLDSVDFAVIDEGLGRPASFFGVLMAIQGAGGICGGLLATRLIQRYGEARTVGVGLLSVSLGTALLAAPNLPVVICGFVAIGFGLPWLMVGYMTAWQRYASQEIVGRVAAAADLCTVGPQTLSIALGVVLISVVDYRVLLGVCFVVLATCGVVLIRAATRIAIKEPVE
ncbi:MFS transporter [Nonomuraea endophytica]|uniref:MFS transporter n=1 Tax=Nonomuraea endophytica TaxID=714136 RepID=UPI0037C55B40